MARAPLRANAAGPVLVRRAGRSDAPVVAALRLALLREEQRSPLFAAPHHSAVQRAATLTARQLRSANGREVIFLAEQHGEPIGVLRCFVRSSAGLVRTSRFAAITTVFVVRAARRRGVLTALLGAADEWCRERHIAEMRLHCTVENAGGNAAWRALGFSPVQILHRRIIPPA